jgi:putative membrane protein
VRLLVLNVDRDDDLGRKTGIRAPIIGREEMLRAATALAIADPEEADANGMFAAIKEYDEIASKKLEYDADEVFVAAVTGHIREGLVADNMIAHQIDQIIAATKADAVILVSDGGEDEHVLPILKSRVKVNGIKRVIIKQARNLEGALFLFSRLIHDEKLQKRFFMPLALLLIAAGAAIILGKPEVFVAASLFLGALYIIVQVFALNEPLGNVAHRFADQMRAGKLSLFSALAALVLVLVGGFRTLQRMDGLSPDTTTRYTILFAHEIFWWLVAAVALIILGRGSDRYVREHIVRGRHWEGLIFFLATAAIGYAVIMVVEARTRTPPVQMPLLDVGSWLLFGGFFFFSGLIAHQYFAQLSAARRRAAEATGTK